MIHISTSFALLVVAIIILVCIAGSRLSGRLGVPTLFIFIMLGMLFGSDGIFKIPFGNFALAEQVCSVARAGVRRSRSRGGRFCYPRRV